MFPLTYLTCISFTLHEQKKTRDSEGEDESDETIFDHGDSVTTLTWKFLPEDMVSPFLGVTPGWAGVTIRILPLVSLVWFHLLQ